MDTNSLIAWVDLGSAVLAYSTVVFGALGLFELLRPNPKVKP